jgi:hypothetical protein
MAALAWRRAEKRSATPIGMRFEASTGKPSAE